MRKRETNEPTARKREQWEERQRMGGRERDEEIEDKKRWKRKGRRCGSRAASFDCSGGPPRILFRVRLRE
jgi:ribosome assembly protein YihI (activator of Der GTPase)